jgi:glycosyltransferase involved in cell wall biosynthesis
MQNKLFFSIVIPTYNRATFITKTIESVLNQTYIDFEIIIIDDGSTDNTSEVVHAIKDARVLYFKKQNEERAKARNYGTMKAKGDYITFLDSDDVLLPDHFLNAYESIVKYNNPPFLHLGYEIAKIDGTLIYRADHLQNDDIDFLIRGNSLSCVGCFLRADICKKFLFNEDKDLSGSEDWELWFRLLANHGIKTDNRVSARMYDHENRSVSSSHVQEAKLILRKELALKYAFADPMVKQYYEKHFKKIDAFGDSYIALHLGLIGDSKRSFHFLLKFVKGYPRAIFSKRFLVIIKYLVLKSVKPN